MAMQDSMIEFTGESVTVTINRLAWHEGMQRSRAGGSTFDNPYPLGSAEAYSWLSGFIGTDEKIRRDDTPSEGGSPLMG